MKKIVMAMVLVTTFLFSASAFAGEACVHHVVLFDLKDDVTPEQIEEFIIVGEALLSKIPGVQEVSINKKAREDRGIHIKDYDVALYVRWENNEAGNVYGPHTLHQTLLKLYKQQWAGVKIIDFYGN
ncbi:MAG: Dabb family protein [Desulfobacterales bacterium]|nr:MAG: Dabb family protein [Desulfobacterales bacterium]